MFYVSTLCITLIAPIPASSAKAMAPADFLATCRAQEAAVVKFFADESVWKPERKAELIVQLQVAGIVKPRAIIPTLLKHLTYYDNAHEVHTRAPETEMVYPAYGALKQYGPLINEQLVAHLKRNERRENERQDRIESSLAINLFCDLAHDRKVSVAIARIRIQHEIDQFPNVEFPRLKELLKHTLLKD